MSWNRLFLAVTVSKTPDRWIVKATMGVITGLLVSSVVIAADEAPTPSPTMQEEKATPADPGEVQERGIQPMQPSIRPSNPPGQTATLSSKKKQQTIKDRQKDFDKIPDKQLTFEDYQTLH
jgi:hypothetical protein